jgi:hypothetical protein
VDIQFDIVVVYAAIIFVRNQGKSSYRRPLLPRVMAKDGHAKVTTAVVATMVVLIARACANLF